MTGPTGRIRIANAPVSFGIFELTAGESPPLTADELLDALSAAGYDGVDLGPPGYLGSAGQLTDRLAARGLALAGGWVALRFADADGFAADMASLRGLLPLFSAAAALAAGCGLPPPRPTLADAGSEQLRACLGSGAQNAEHRLDDQAWRRLCGRVQAAADAVRAGGLAPTFHPHACTYVETTGEIERLLESTDVGLCLDSGHLVLGGGDPLRAWADWGGRINQVHLKDLRRDVLHDAVAEHATMRELWARGVFCGLGKGDVDVGGLTRRILDSGYEGWLVVEQDVIPAPGTTAASLAAAQAANREELRRYGL